MTAPDGQPDLHGEGEEGAGGAAIGVAHVADGVDDARDQVERSPSTMPVCMPVLKQ